MPAGDCLRAARQTSATGHVSGSGPIGRSSIGGPGSRGDRPRYHRDAESLARQRAHRGHLGTDERVARLELARRHRAFQPAPQGGVVAVGDQVRAGELLERDARALAPLVPDREGDDELVLPQERGGELVAERVGIERREAAVELVRAQGGEQIVLRALDHVDRHARVGAAEVREHSEEVVGARRVDAADAQLALDEAADLLELGCAGRRPRRARAARSRG